MEGLHTDRKTQLDAVAEDTALRCIGYGIFYEYS